MFPFVLLVLNLVAWVTLGAVFVVLSGVAISVAKPLFHLIKDSINQRKIEKEEGQDREKVVDGNEKRSANANVEIESPRSLLNDVEVSRQKLLLSSKNFVSETIKGNYKCWLFDDEINDIAEKQYGYPDSDNGVMFTTWSLYIIKETVPNSSKEIRKRIERLDEDFFHWYREGIKETGGLDRPIYTLILGLKDHWVTLTIAYDNESKRFRAYYCNSFGGIYNRIDRELLDCLEEGKFFSLRKEDIRVSKTRQQKDGCNCGIYALENAKIITEMMKESRSFDEIDEKLAEYVHADEKQEEKRLQVKRKEFARVLINDMSHMSDSDFKQKIEGYERT